MARITSYPKHIPVQPNDTWIGTRASNLMTRNFTAKAVGEYINISGLISISACMLYKFEITNAGPGDITGVPDLTPFANITSLNINAIDISGQNTVGFLEYIVGTEILISEQNEISTFGHYNIDSYTQIGTTSFYTLNLTFIGGSGSIEEKKQYDTCSFVLSSTDNNTTYDLDSIQNGANSDIRLVGSDLTTDIVKLEAGTNVTLTDTGSNILIDVTAVGTVTSIDASIDGDSLSIAGVPITSAGTIAFNWEGTNLQYVDGEGNLQTFPTLPTGTVTSVGQTHAGNAFSVTGSPITTAGVLAIGLNGNATQYIDGAGDLQTFPAIPVVPSNIVETLDTTDSTYIDLTPTIPTTGDVVVTAELSAIDGNAAAGERYLTKTNKWAEISTIPGTYEWEIQGDTGGPTVVNSTDIVTFVGGTNVSTALVGTALTIDATDTNTTYDLTVPVATTNITLLGSDASSDSVTLTGGTNITVTRVSATELSIDGTDLNTTYNLEGVGSVDGTAGVRLAGSDASNDDVLIIGAGTTTVTRSLNTLTVTSNDQFDGTVTNVSASTTGDALDVAVTSPTTTPDLDLTWAGTASQYVDGQGDLQTFPAIPIVGDGILIVQGTGVLGGTGTFTANQAGNTTISVTHNAQSQSNTTPTATLTHGGTFTAISANVGVNASGHVTGQELTTFTLPSDTQGVTSVNFKTDGDALNVVSNTITTSGTMTGVWQGASSQYVNGEGDLRDITSIPGTYEWDIAGDSGSGTVGAGDIINFAGGTNVTTAYSGTTLTINSTDQFQGTVTSVATTHAGNAFTASIGGVATVNPSVDITMNGSSVEYVDGAGNLQTFPAIPQGDITDVEGGTYITTVNSTGPIVTVNHDSTSRTDNTSTITPAAGDIVTAVDSVTTNTTGHVTGLNLKSIVLPTASESSETIDIQVKNISSANGGVNLVKGDPVYIYGSVGASARLLVDLADADSTATNNLSDSKMPCVALLDQDLAPNIEGTATVVGKLRNLITSPIDGVTPSENDTIYVKSGGGLTLTKPTGSTNLIQNVGQVGRVSTSADGNIVVAALLRTNDVPNLPTGRLFVGTAANTSLASDVVYVDDANDRVGINTATPGADLEVVGTSGVIVDSGSGANAKLTLKGGVSGAYGGGGEINVIGGPLDFMNYNLNLKNSPSALEANNQYFQGNAGWSWDGNIRGIRATPYTSYNFKSQGSSQMVIYNNNVGIGTTSPGTKLDVAGTGSFSDSVLFNKAVPTGAITPTRYRSHTGYSLTSDSNYQKMVCYGYNGISTNPIFQVATKSFAADVTAAWDNDASTRFTVLAGGDVGIGTTSPDELLHLSSTGPARLLIEADTDNVTETDNAQIILKQDGGAVVGNLGFKTNTNGLEMTSQYAGADGILTFGTRNTERMRVSDLGKVGIGTTSPKTMLHVVGGTSGATWTATAGTTGIFESSTSDRSFVTITGEDEAELWFGDFTTQAKGRVRYQTDTNVMSFWTNATPKITIDASGNTGNVSDVGIGTTSMTTISSSIATLSLGSQNSGVSGGIAFQANGVVKAYNYVASSYLYSQTVTGIGQIFFGAGSERMRIHNTTGNVGIGITNPSEKLDIVGNIKVSGDQYFNGAVMEGDGKEMIRYSDSWLRINEDQDFTNGIYCGSGILRTDGNLQVGSSGSKFTVNSSGNVGIGTTSPNVKLEIGGGSTLARVIPAINNQGYIGDSQHRWQAIYATNGTIQTSDIREKTEIKPIKLGLDFINDLAPVSYKWIEGERLDASKDERNHHGLIAQEVAKTLEKHGVDKNKFGGLDIQKTDEYDDFHAMSYEQLIAPMIKAIQELKTEIEELKKQINK